MATDEEVLRSNRDWTDLRHEVCRIVQEGVPGYDVKVDGDGILVCKNGEPWVLIGQIGLGLYRTKWNASGNPGDPWLIVGGGKNIGADQLLQQIKQDITDIEGRRKRVPSSR